MFEYIDCIAGIGCCDIFSVQYLPLFSASAGHWNTHTYLAVSGISVLERIQNVEGIFILQNSSLKLKSVADNAILLNYAVSSENISECKK